MRRFPSAIIVLIILTAIPLTLVRGQNQGTTTRMIGSDPLALLSSVYRIHYSRLSSDKSLELNYSFSHFPAGTLTEDGGGVTLRLYRDKNGMGLFYGGGIWLFLSVSDIGDVDPDRGIAISMVPDIFGEIGYRMYLLPNISIAPWIGPGLRFDIPLAEGGTGSRTGLDVFLGVDLCYSL